MTRSLVIVTCLAAIALALSTGCRKGERARSTPSTSPQTSPEGSNAIVRGRIVDPKGKAVPGVRVRLWYVNPSNDFEYQDENATTSNVDGSYGLAVKDTRIRWVVVGGTASTRAESKRFTLKPGQEYELEDLVVRPANATCKGRIVFEDGRPAANVPYGWGYASQSLPFVDPFNPPRTTDAGEFFIEHLLPNEPFYFWALPAENTLWVKRNLRAGSGTIQLILAKREYLDLPEDWQQGLTHEAIAGQTVSVPDSRVQFALNDLDGNLVSLADERFLGHVVVVNITGSWCGSCNLEMPYLIDFQDRYGPQGLQIVSIAFERGSREEQIQSAKRFSLRYPKLNFPMLIGSGSTKHGDVETAVKGLKGFGGYPTNLYIDRGGRARYVHSGFYASSEQTKKWQITQMEDHIVSLLKE